MTAPPSAKPQPKTFNHAIARASLASSNALNVAEQTGQQDLLAQALEKYAIAEEKVGEARLSQDAAIQAKFLQGWSTTLNSSIKLATRARTQVENSRLNLDATKAKIKSNVGPGHDEGHYSEDQRAEIEAKEDDFVAQTEEAVGVMKNVGLEKHAHKIRSRLFTDRRNIGAGYPGAAPQPCGTDCRSA